MAAPFDFSRPSPTIYDLSNAAGAVKLQKVAREFMEVVRETPDMNAEHIFSFCKLVEAAWLSRRYFERGATPEEVAAADELYERLVNMLEN
ncbi:uncharacterized protein PV06_04848 [Exophiala oligosperma]|uniref:Uncharacterized protein n=1 Tax=Exophiala oligosperma TaxID=215243 RepID=A0A0D2AVF0_9EURO|nr:uncharacterized protein PV06_04848 [Exophiala oligosperma]KIW43781.1 hypothetical protein PV06_04848 [Exophiala oligosperma]